MLLATCIAQEPLLLVLLAAKKCNLEMLLAHSLVNLLVFSCNASSGGGEGLVFCCHLRPARCNSLHQTSSSVSDEGAGMPQWGPCLRQETGRVW